MEAKEKKELERLKSMLESLKYGLIEFLDGKVYDADDVVAELISPIRVELERQEAHLNAGELPDTMPEVLDAVSCIFERRAL
ncbi:MAG: hypothetical protein PUF10_02920 [Bacteroidales bacterium]|nr:hypothetical protein [Bacteroidales bacterium]